MCRHAGFWLGVGQHDENSLTARERTAVSGESSAFHCFVLCILLICIVVVPVPFACCSVKRPLSRPTSFCLFLSILLRTPAGGGAAAWHFCCQLQPNHNNAVQESCTGTYLILCELKIPMHIHSTSVEEKAFLVILIK